MWVCGYDLHFPEVHRPTFNAMLDFINRNRDKVAGFIFGGDQLSNTEISHHTKGKPLYRPTGSYLKNHKDFQTQILDPLHAALPSEARRIWIEGNHDEWSQQLVEVQPELKGLVENHLLLKVQEQGWEFFPCGTRFKLGRLNVIHGETLSGSGNQAPGAYARKAVEMYAGSVLFGHFHTPQSYTKILPHDVTQKWIGQCSAILGKTNPLYLRNKATAWMCGFTLVEMQDSGNFHVYPIIVVNGKFSFAGELYGG